MENTKFFTTETGLSMSEANHIANLAKEIAEVTNTEIVSSGAVKETVSWLGKDIVIKDPKKIDLNALAIKEGELYAVSAWLRSAINTKEKNLEFLKGAISDYFKLDTDEVLEFKERAPEQKLISPLEHFTEADVLHSWTIAEIADYYAVEASAAHLGKKIHKAGFLSILRKDVLNFTPFRTQSFKDKGLDTDQPVVRTLVYSPEEINKIFFDLQDKHRSFEQKLNWYKARIKNELAVLNTNERVRYTKDAQIANEEYQMAKSAYDLKRQAYLTKSNLYQNELEKRRIAEVTRVSALKIVVPIELEKTIDYIKSFRG